MSDTLRTGLIIIGIVFLGGLAFRFIGAIPARSLAWLGLVVMGAVICIAVVATQRRR